MDSPFHVVLPIEPETTDVRPVVTRNSTRTNQQPLYPLIRRARVTQGCGTATVDLTGVRTEPTAPDLWRWDLVLDWDESPDQLAPSGVRGPRAPRDTATTEANRPEGGRADPAAP
jgi:hypothetical protein